MPAYGVDPAGSALPWDLVVPGVPASLQSKGKKRAGWKAQVICLAASRWGGPPLHEPLGLTMVLFHNGESIDVDNMIKPTCDALVGIVFASDAQLEDVHGLRRDLRLPLRLRQPSPVLAEGLATYGATGETFVYVRVTAPRDLEELLT